MLLCPICERGSIAVSSVSMSAIYFLLYNCPHRLFSVTYYSSMVQNISLFCAILFFLLKCRLVRVYTFVLFNHSIFAAQKNYISIC